ncbi:hypothetical protein E1K68_11375 [Pseudomonas sp. B2021]|nr:hypothetical protein [Pseudomonas sp. B2021]GLH50352.1 hypothetical protein RS3R2_40390 [Pseudomonas lactis]
MAAAHGFKPAFGHTEPGRGAEWWGKSPLVTLGLFQSDPLSERNPKWPLPQEWICTRYNSVGCQGAIAGKPAPTEMPGLQSKSRISHCFYRSILANTCLILRLIACRDRYPLRRGLESNHARVAKMKPVLNPAAITRRP